MMTTSRKRSYVTIHRAKIARVNLKRYCALFLSGFVRKRQEMSLSSVAPSEDDVIIGSRQSDTIALKSTKCAYRSFERPRNCG
jgi:hypothetical protein